MIPIGLCRAVTFRNAFFWEKRGLFFSRKKIRDLNGIFSSYFPTKVFYWKCNFHLYEFFNLKRIPLHSYRISNKYENDEWIHHIVRWDKITGSIGIEITREYLINFKILFYKNINLRYIGDSVDVSRTISNKLSPCR